MTKHNIAERKGTTGSSRAKLNKLFVVKRACKYCSSTKGLDTKVYSKCSRCKKEV